ncbi:MAG: alpha/beta hydrolase [Gammaproteobacteria bacterium]
MNARQVFTHSLFVIVALALGGCISAGYVADKIVNAPNGGHPKPASGFLGKVSRTFYSEQYAIPVGPPPARLAFAVIEPRNYGFSASAEWKKKPEALVLKWRIHNTKIDLQKGLSGAEAARYLQHMLQEAIPKLPICRATGTVILLPGWGERKETLLGYALDFANHGYRVILVDLRGQGESSGKYVTYGLIEHRDIIQLISALYARKLAVGRLALVGFSEGATIALDTAANDVRVDAVVAVAPFVDLKTAIRGVGHDFMPALSKMVGLQKLDKALGIADKKTGMTLADANPDSRVANIRAPVLYVAGGKDDISPPVAVEALAAKTPHARFVEVPGYPHTGLYFGVAAVGPPTLDALARGLGSSPDTACLQAPLPQNVRYDFDATITITKRK